MKKEKLNEDCLLPKNKKKGNKIVTWFKQLFSIKIPHTDLPLVQPLNKPIGELSYFDTPKQEVLDQALLNLEKYLESKNPEDIKKELDSMYDTKYDNSPTISELVNTIKLKGSLYGVTSTSEFKLFNESDEYKQYIRNSIKNKKLEPSLVANILITPDGTRLESNNRHDFKTHIDKVNGKRYMIDGGLDYCKRSCNGDEKTLFITSDIPHDIVRLYAFRTGYGEPNTPSYGKNHILTRICYMSDSYLQASIDYVIKHKNYGNHLNTLLDEQIYRIKNNVSNIVNLDFEIIK